MISFAVLPISSERRLERLLAPSTIAAGSISSAWARIASSIGPSISTARPCASKPSERASARALVGDLLRELLLAAVDVVGVLDELANVDAESLRRGGERLPVAGDHGLADGNEARRRLERRLGRLGAVVTDKQRAAGRHLSR